MVRIMNPHEMRIVLHYLGMTPMEFAKHIEIGKTSIYEYLKSGPPKVVELYLIELARKKRREEAERA